MLGFLKSVPLKIWAGSTALVTLVIGSFWFVIDSLGYVDEILASIGRPLVRDGLLWLFSTPSWVPAAIWLGAVVALWVLVWISVKPEREFLELRREWQAVQSFVDRTRDMVMLRARAVQIIHMRSEVAKCAADICEWGYEPNPTSGPMLGSRLTVMPERIKRMIEAAGKFMESPPQGGTLAKAAEINVNLRNPAPCEDRRPFIDEKQAAARSYWHTLMFVDEKLANEARRFEERADLLESSLGAKK